MMTTRTCTCTCTRTRRNSFRRQVCVIPLILASFPTVTAFASFPVHRRQSLTTKRSRCVRRPESVSCNLFFRKTDKTPAPRRKSLKPGVVEELQSPDINLPFQILLEDDDSDETEEVLTVRFMTSSDLRFILPLCIYEFGTGPTVGLKDFPWQDLRLLSMWWDCFYFEPSITFFFIAKMSGNMLRPKTKQTFEDPAVLVLSRQHNQTETVVGMVELSLQPADANRNPPALPLPLWLKELYCTVRGQTLQGWVTNLLIDPKYRGLGYSKILMAATEGIARSWNRSAIYLHADADFKSGKIPQGLYKGLDYEVVTEEDPQFAWMGDNFNPFSSVRMIQGVPLLCFYKKL